MQTFDFYRTICRFGDEADRTADSSGNRPAQYGNISRQFLPAAPDGFAARHARQVMAGPGPDPGIDPAGYAPPVRRPAL
jgi:hypothetical protein